MIAADTLKMPATQALIAALVAAASGYGVIRTGRTMTATGVETQNGGGWVALLALLVMTHLVAVAIALS